MAKKGKNKGTVPIECAEVKVNNGIFEDRSGPEWLKVSEWKSSE